MTRSVYFISPQEQEHAIFTALSFLAGSNGNAQRIGVLCPTSGENTSQIEKLYTSHVPTGILLETSIPTSWDAVYADHSGSINKIVQAYQDLCARCDLVIVCPDSSTAVAGFDSFGWLCEVGANLNLPLTLVVKPENDAQFTQLCQVANTAAKAKHANLSSIVSLADGDQSGLTADVEVIRPATVGVPAGLPSGHPTEMLNLPAATIDKIAQNTAATQQTHPVTTPSAFQIGLMNQARRGKAKIVLPEPEDDRVLKAAAIVLEEKVADLVLIGDAAAINARAKELGLDVSAAEIISPQDPQRVEKYAAELARLREKKGMTIEKARELVQDVSYFGTMMVHFDEANGMVSGAAHTTAHTISPALQIIKTKPGINIVSSIFLMLMTDRVYVFGDCAVMPEPTPEQLADIAISSAQTAAQFGVDPKVAMLSYSTGASGTGAAVEAVIKATELVQSQAPDLPLAGPIQFDAAVDMSVGASKMPGNPVAGQATVFIFPNLESGNIGYKAVQRTAGAVAVGPVLQGLNKPVNDLSRGALVEDIVNTVVITAIQAQSS